MPTTDQPIAACHRDSARVEKRGPSMTTMVPPSTACQPRPSAAPSAASRPIGQYGIGERGVHDVAGPCRPAAAHRRRRSATRAFVRSTSWSGTSSVPGPYSSRRPPTAHGPEHLAHPDRAQRPQVGAVVDAVRRQVVAAAVAGQERHLPAGDLAEEERVAGGAVGSVHLDLGDVLEERVEARAADDADLCVNHAGHTNRGRERQNPRRGTAGVMCCGGSGGRASARRGRRRGGARRRGRLGVRARRRRGLRRGRTELDDDAGELLDDAPRLSLR